MSNKINIQFFLIFAFIIITLLVYFKYFKETIDKSDFKVNTEKNTSTGESLIEDLKYIKICKVQYKKF